jgi:predicted RNA-binding protein with PIN domain
MPLHIVIDGYNLIRRSPSLSLLDHDSLEEGRTALLERLVSYRRFKGHSVTVVFDATHAHGTGDNRSRWKGIDVVFSLPGELADTVIKRIAAREGQRAVVVTSDKELAGFAARQGAATLESQEFEERMKLACYASAEVDGLENEEPPWEPTTRKKGPARRRSKSERKRRFKTKRL